MTMGQVAGNGPEPPADLPEYFVRCGRCFGGWIILLSFGCILGGFRARHRWGAPDQCSGTVSGGRF